MLRFMPRPVSSMVLNPIEWDAMPAVFEQCCTDGLVRRHGVAFDAGNSGQPADITSGHAQLMLQGDLGGVSAMEQMLQDVH